MKTLLVALALLIPVAASANTLDWDRNVETDLKDYQIWACFTPNCVVIKAPGMLQPVTVAQPAVGVRPTTQIDFSGKEGAVAVSARDLSLNESELSVQVPFDFLAPPKPQNLHLK